jgi:hypothetical protein
VGVDGHELPAGHHAEYSIDDGKTWTTALPDWQQGENTVLVRQGDDDGRYSGATAFTFIFDSEIEDLGITLSVDSGASNSDHYTNQGALTLSKVEHRDYGDGVIHDAVVEYALDYDPNNPSAATWLPWPSDDFASAAVEGRNEVWVRQTDVAGNVSQPTGIVFTLDLHANSPAIITAYDHADLIQGVIHDGAFTEDAAPTLSGGGGEAHSLIRVYDEVRGLLGTTTADANGNWAWTPPADLADGTYVIRVTSEDLAGNVSQPSNARTFIIDTLKPSAIPTITSLYDDVLPVIGNVVNGGVSNDPTPKLSGTAAPNTMVEIREGAIILGRTRADGSGNWSFTSNELSDGEHIFTAVILSASGIAGDASAPWAVTIVTAIEAPVITSITPDNGPIGLPGSGADFITNVKQPVLNGLGLPNVTVSVYLEGVFLGTALANNLGEWSFNLPVLSEGVHRFTAQQAGPNGNTSLPSAPRSVTIDTVAPTATVSPESIANPVTLGNQTYPSIAKLPGGGYVVGWRDANLGSGLQIYDATGNRIGQQVSHKSEGTTFISRGSVITTLNSGNIVQTYWASGTTLADVYYRIYSPSGDLIKNTAVLSSANNGVEIWVTVTPLSGGGFVAAWSSSISGSFYEIHTRVFNASGTALGNDIVVSQAQSSVTGDAWSGKIAALSNGGFVVTWTVAASGGNGLDVYAQRYSVSGSTVTAQGSITRVNVTTAGDQANAEAVGLADGSYVIAWQGPDGDGSGLYFRRFSANGTALDSSDQLINVTTAGNQYFPQGSNFSPLTDAGGTAITALANGGFAVVWTSQYQDGSGFGTYLRLFNASGSAATPEILINTTTEGDQYSPVITALADGRLAVAWVAAGQDGSGEGIIQTLFNADGSKINPIANVYIDEDQLLGEAVLSFAAGSVAPEFRLNGNLVAFSAIKNVYGIDVTWDASASKLILTGAANGAAYERVLHLVTIATTQSNVSLLVTDLAGNQAAPLGGLEVHAPGAAAATPAPTQSVTIASVYATDGAHPGNVSHNGTTDDLSLSLSGTLSAPLSAGQAVLIYDNGTLIGTATVSGTAWTSQYQVFAEGDHSYTARVIDLTGAQGGLSSAYVVHIVLDVPVIDAIIDNYAPVLGTVSQGGFTNDAKPVISGHGNAGAVLNVYNNGALVGSTTVDASGHWALLPSVNLVEGSHSFTTAYVVATTGLVGASSSAYTVTIDRTPPEAPVIVSITDAAATSLMPGATVGSSTITLGGTAEAGAVITLHDGDTLLIPATLIKADASGQWTYTTPVLLDGEHNFNATATDAAGNVSTPSHGVALGINTSPLDAPIIYAILDNVGPVQGNFVNGSETDDTTPMLYGTGAYANGTVRVFDGMTVLGEVTADANGNWTYTPTLTNHQTVILSAANVVKGVEGPHAGSWTLTVNTDAPAAPTITQVFDNVLEMFGTILDGGMTNDARPVVSGTGAVPNGVVNLYDTASGSTTLIGSAIADQSGHWAINIAHTLSDGPHSLSVTAMSLDGVESTAASPAYSFTVDTAPPPAPTFTLGPDTGLFNNDGITNAAAQTLSGAANSTEGKATISLYDGLTLLGTTTAAADGSWSFTTTTLADGAHTLYATAMDAAGNVSERSVVHGITVDTVAPTVNISDFTVNNFLPNSQTQPQSTKLVGGGYVTVWTSAYQDGSGLGVYLQRFDAAGNPSGVETRVNTQTANDQWRPAVAALTDGSYVVTWQSALQDGSGLGVYMQRFNADGIALGSETRVNTYTTGDQLAPQVVALTNGGYVVGWNSVGQAGSSTNDSAYFQIYDVNGAKVGAETRVNSSTSNSEKFTSITALSGGGFVVTYFTQLLPAFGYFKIYNASGTVAKTDTKLVAPDSGGLLFYTATALASGGFATVQGSAEGGVNLQIYNASGTLQGSAVPLSIPPSNMVQLANGDIAMAWASSNVVRVQLAQANGSLIGTALTISHDPAHDNAAPVITALPNGNFVVSWQTNAGGTYDIVQHLFAVSGTASAPVITPINQVSELHLSDANALADASLTFGAAYGASTAPPSFHDAAGNTLTYAQIQANYGIAVTWNSGSGALTLAGAASAASYETLLHMLNVGGTASLTASLNVEDIAGNTTTVNGITVDPGNNVASSSSAVQMSSDTLKVADTGINLDLDSVKSSEPSDPGSSSHNTLSVSLQDVLNIPDTTAPQLQAMADAPDTLKTSDGFAQADTAVVNNANFDVWHANAGADLATLLLEQDIHVQPVA